MIVKYLSARNRTKTEAAIHRFESSWCIVAPTHLLHDPADQIPYRFLQQRSATLADRRQTHRSPATHTRFIQFPYQKTVRQEHAVRVSGLTHAVPKLTISQSQFLLSVSVKGLRARPTTAIRFDDPLRVPVNLVRYENLPRPRVVFVTPQDHDADLVVDIRHRHADAQIPLLDAVDRHRLAGFGTDRLRELHRLLFDALERQLAVELQIADVTAFRSILVFQAVDVILNRSTSVKTVEGEVAGNVFLATPIDQFDSQFRHLLELFAGPLALTFFFETTELQRVMLAAGRVDVVDDDQILGVLVPLLGVIPERAGVLDELAGLVEEHVVDGDDASRMELRVVELLQPFDASLVDGVLVPFDFGEEAIETRLVGGVGHFVGHSGDGLVVRNHQAGQVIGEMFSLRFVFEQGCEEFLKGVSHDFRRCNDWHGSPFPNVGNFFRRSPDRSGRQSYKVSGNFAKV